MDLRHIRIEHYHAEGSIHLVQFANTSQSPLALDAYRRSRYSIGTYMVIAYHPSFSHSNGTQVLEAVREPFFVNPIRQRPVFFWHDFIVTLRGGKILSRRHELVCERLVIEEDPWILVFPVPSALHLFHALSHSFQFLIPHEAGNCSAWLWSANR